MNKKLVLLSLLLVMAIPAITACGGGSSDTNQVWNIRTDGQTLGLSPKEGYDVAVLVNIDNDKSFSVNLFFGTETGYTMAKEATVHLSYNGGAVEKIRLTSGAETPLPIPLGNNLVEIHEFEMEGLTNCNRRPATNTW